jgi:hypothetical protein
VAAFLAGALQGGSVRCALVVAPTTLLAQWATELQGCGLGGRVHTFAGSSRATALREVTRRGGVLLTSYGMVLHNATDLGAPKEGDGGEDDDDSPSAVRWDWLVADEGHKLKNPKMQLVACMRRLPAARRLILTGTPVQNNLGELWALADFAVPGLLGDARAFRDQFEKPISRGTSRDASARERQVGVATSEALRTKLAPALLRREKRTVFGDAAPGQASSSDAAAADVAATHEEGDSAPSGAPLGTKVDLIVWLKLSPPQRRLYAAFLGSSSVAAALNKTNSALAAITVLKKICDHPGLLSERAAAEIARGQAPPPEQSSSSESDAGPGAEGDEEVGALGAGLDPVASCKTAFVLHFVATVAAKGHRTLIFSQSRVMLDGLQAALSSAGHRLCRIDGGVATAERARLVAKFQGDATIPVFLLSSAVGGLGLTLTGADRVIIVDPSWNPAADAQSVDRAYRMGQTRDVAVYRLITSGTVEEKIYRKQVFKAGLSIAGTSGGDVARYFTSGELRDLFACDPAGLDQPVTAQVLLARHGAPHTRAPPSIAEEVTTTVQPFPCCAAVTDHSALFSAPDDTAAGPGELNPPLSSASSATSAPAGLGPGQPVKFLGAAAPWRGGSLSGGVIAASLAKFPAQVAAQSVSEPHSAAALAAEAAARKALRVTDMQAQLQRYAKLLMDPVTARLPDGGAKVRARCCCPTIVVSHRLTLSLPLPTSSAPKWRPSRRSLRC